MSRDSAEAHVLEALDMQQALLDAAREVIDDPDDLAILGRTLIDAVLADLEPDHAGRIQVLLDVAQRLLLEKGGGEDFAADNLGSPAAVSLFADFLFAHAQLLRASVSPAAGQS